LISCDELRKWENTQFEDGDSVGFKVKRAARRGGGCESGQIGWEAVMAESKARD